MMWKLYKTAIGGSSSVTLPVTFVLDADRNVAYAQTGYDVTGLRQTLAGNDPTNYSDDIHEYDFVMKYGQSEARSMLSDVNALRTGSEAWAWDSSNTTKVHYDASPLTYDYGLELNAMKRAAEIAIYYSHTRPNGESCFSCFPSVQGYIGENLAAGYRTPEAVVDGWMNSPGHRANILRKEFRSIGIGLVIADDRYGYYCAQSFGDTVDTVVTYSGTSYGGVDYSSIFNYSYYLTKNPDVKKACQYSRKDSFSVIKHFLNYGMAEGRATTSSFNVSIYKENYPDLQKAYGNDLKKYYLHYMNYGKKEGRNATSIIKAPTSYGGVNYSAVYDYNYYIKNNPDVKKAFGGDKTATLKHFVNYGMAEGRRAKASIICTISTMVRRKAV